MDKISKRSKGYAFIEYATEEAASAALKEMNGKASFVFDVFFSSMLYPIGLTKEIEHSWQEAELGEHFVASACRSSMAG